MELQNSFTAPAPVEQTWDFLNDVPRVIPCMPGAELLETLGEDAWKARVSVKVGPIGLKFDAEVTRQERDADAHRVVLVAKAREIRGRGAANATITSSLQPAADGTEVLIATDLALQGPVAQYGRAMVAEISGQMTAAFADALSQELAAASPAGEAAPAAAAAAAAPAAGGSASAPPAAAPRPGAAATRAKPVNGLRLVLRALMSQLLGRFKRGRAKG
jgi:uncharacterized protein